MTTRWQESGWVEVTAMGDRHRSFVRTMSAHTEQITAATLSGSGFLMATEEPGRVTLSGGEYASEWVPGADGRLVYCPAFPGPPRQTRLRKTARPPGLYDLRQAYLDADGAIAAGESLLAFLGALGRVRSEAGLDVLTGRRAARVPDEGGAALVLVAVMTVVIPALTLLTGWSGVAVVLYALTGLAVFRYATRRRRAGSVEIPGERETE